MPGREISRFLILSFWMEQFDTDSLAIGSLVTKRRERKERRKGRRRGREEKKERREGGWEGGRDLAGQKDRNCPDS